MVDIMGYGACIPQYRIKGEEIARVWGGTPTVSEKAVPGPDEDATTIAIEASRNALRRSEIDPSQLGAVFVGTESKPYAVKPTAVTVAEALGATPDVSCADFEFACAAGSQAMRAGMAYVEGGMAQYALGVGADCSQASPGDDLDYTVGAGGAAYIVGNKGGLARIEGSCSWVTDTPDFWRRAHQRYPVHTYRFTGLAYFKHTTEAARTLMERLGTEPHDYRYAVFHQPNVRFPQRAASQLGFSSEQVKPGLLSPVIGNAYAGSMLLGLTAVLDQAKEDDAILAVSYGSGSGSDAFSIRALEGIEEKRGLAHSTDWYVGKKEYIDYMTYLRFREGVRR